MKEKGKKHISCRVAALVLVLALVLGTSALGAVLGEPIHGWETGLATGVRLAGGVYWTSADYRAENYITYTPNGSVVPVVAYGSKVCGVGSFASMAASLTQQGYRVIGGINGDYYNTGTAQPLGLVVSEGRLLSSDGGHWALGFRSDGSAFIGRPNMDMQVVINGVPYEITQFNKVRDNRGFALFSEDFAATTKNSLPGWDVILTLDAGALTMNCDLTFTVDWVRESEGALDLPAGKYVLSLQKGVDSWWSDAVLSLEPGDKVEISIHSDSIWDEAAYGIGSLYKLVTNGQVVAGLEAGAAPRTAVGIKADGSLVFYTVDGRQPGYSVGASMTQVAKRLIELGCVEACIMDGGGSTSLNAMYIGDSSLSQVNKPSGGYQRSVANYIMLVAPDTTPQLASQLAIYPVDTVALAGTAIQYTVRAADRNGLPAALPGSLHYSVTPGLGSISADGQLTASGAGSGTVTVSSAGLTSGTASLTVVEEPDQIWVYRQNGVELAQLVIERGETVDLAAKAMYRHLNLVSDDTCFTWRVVGSIGSVDEDGTFTAANRKGSGSIIVSAGGCSATIPVFVTETDPSWSNPFQDVSMADWYYEAVRYVQRHGLLTGVTADSFCPDMPITRGMLMTVLGRLYEYSGGTVPDVDCTAFADVAPGSYYAKYIQWANQAGIAQGTGQGFSPDAPATREQVCTFLVRYMQYIGKTPAAQYSSLFSDHASISDYAVEAVYILTEAGAIQGVGGNQVNPQGLASRSQVAAILMRLDLL